MSRSASAAARPRALAPPRPAAVLTSVLVFACAALILFGPAAGTAAAATGRPLVAVPGALLLGAAVVMVFVGALGILGIAFVTAAGEQKSAVVRRLEMYSLTGRAVRAEETQTALGDNAVARGAVGFAGKVVAGRGGLEQSLSRRLDASGVPFKPAEWLVLHGAATVLLPVLTLVLAGTKIALVLLALIAGAVVPFLFLSFAEKRRTRRFAEQLPATLQLLAGSLSAGYSLPQALDTVTREAAEPIAGEFNRALVQARLGLPVEDALEATAARMSSKDFAWVVMAIRIQREVGGNLSELLTTVAGTLRERERLRRQVAVLSAEGRLSAYVLAGMPVFFAVFLLLTRPDYILVLVTTPVGLILSGFGLVALAVGGFWLKMVVKVEV